MKNKKKNKVGQFMKGQNRENAKEQGFFDGRFRAKVIQDKIKQADKNACKNWKNDDI